jgi:hypothetical protein
MAVGGENRTVVAEVNAPDVIRQSLVTDDENWAIAYVADGQYSIAVATKNSATAYSSTYGSGSAAFTPDDVWAAALTWASAYATANKLTATAWATAGASAAAGTSSGGSAAVSASTARATIRLELVSHSSSSSSSNSTSVDCILTATDWKFLKRVKPEQRARYLSCECPQGWSHPTGAAKFACERVPAAPTLVVATADIAPTVTLGSAVPAKPAKPVVIASTSKGKNKPAAVASTAKGTNKPVAVASTGKGKNKLVAGSASKGKNKIDQVAVAPAKPKNKGFFATLFRAIIGGKPA